MSDSVAARYDVANFMAQYGPVAAPIVDNWNPRAVTVQTPATANFTVSKTGGGTHTTVQAAVNAAVANGSTARQYIKVNPGTYEELVIVPAGVTITLYGTGEPNAVTIGHRTAAKLTGAQFAAMVNPGASVFNASTPASVKAIYDACANKSSSIGTTCSAAVVIRGNEFQAANISFLNSYDEAANGESQAVALMVDGGDRGVYYRVRFIGNQDTLYIKSSAGDVIGRSYFKSCYVEGDTDFIFGRGTAVFDECSIHFTRARKNTSTIAAPSTNQNNPYGFLFTRSSFSVDPGAESVSFARQWPESSSGGTSLGKVIIRESVIGTSIKRQEPWAPWSSSNPAQYGSAQAPYLAEYHNTGPNAAP